MNREVRQEAPGKAPRQRMKRKEEEEGEDGGEVAEEGT